VVLVQLADRVLHIRPLFPADLAYNGPGKVDAVSEPRRLLSPVNAFKRLYSRIECPIRTFRSTSPSTCRACQRYFEQAITFRQDRKLKHANVAWANAARLYSSVWDRCRLRHLRRRQATELRRSLLSLGTSRRFSCTVFCSTNTLVLCDCSFSLPARTWRNLMVLAGGVEHSVPLLLHLKDLFSAQPRRSRDYT
jgi:hypothetical protein